MWMPDYTAGGDGGGGEEGELMAGSASWRWLWGEESGESGEEG